jgi:hypothetical protein
MISNFFDYFKQLDYFSDDNPKKNKNQLLKSQLSEALRLRA